MVSSSIAVIQPTLVLIGIKYYTLQYPCRKYYLENAGKKKTKAKKDMH